MKKSLIIDSHVHVYPQFNLRRAMENALKNFQRMQRRCRIENAQRFLLLTERHDCFFFQDLVNVQMQGFYFEKTGDKEAVAVQDSATKETWFYILAGRQIIVVENLEICALATTFSVPDKSLDAATTIDAINKAGGIAAVNWAPGKWFGRRGDVVQSLFSEFSPDELFISDTTMRPTIWPTPKLMQKAGDKGFRILSGSDPLPFRGEESKIASYTSLVKGDFDPAHPATFLKQILRSRESSIKTCGRRSGPFSFVKRQSKIMLVK